MRTDIAKLAVAALLMLWQTLAHAESGKKTLEEFAKQGQVYDDPRWQEYVQKVGDRLVANSSEPNREFHFTVLDLSDVNAFAMPDGYIFVYRGLIAYLESEDQLAGGDRPRDRPRRGTSFGEEECAGRGRQRRRIRRRR